MLVKAYRYLYYRIYAWNLRVWGESDLPQFNALFGVSFLIFINLMTLLAGFEVVTDARIFIDRWLMISIGVLTLLIGYFTLVHDQKLRLIREQFKNETSLERKHGFVSCLIYVVSSFVAFIAVVSVRNW
jgi:hypothetical protein